jgi:futalosine hydrolase
MTVLILTPTTIEMQRVQPAIEAAIGKRSLAFQVCGFGQIVAAARAAALVTRYQPSRVLLVGIAGTFDSDRAPVGSACRFDEVICHGVGVGTGQHYRGAEQIGWLQFGDDQTQPHIGDVIPLVSTFVPDIVCAGSLLSVTSASADAGDAEIRKHRYPKAVAEDMEGFGVAAACALAGKSLQVVRGISNIVGDRNKEHWKIDDALNAACEMAVQLIERDWIPTQA